MSYVRAPFGHFNATRKASMPLWHKRQHEFFTTEMDIYGTVVYDEKSRLVRWFGDVIPLVCDS